MNFDVRSENVFNGLPVRYSKHRQQWVWFASMQQKEMSASSLKQLTMYLDELNANHRFEIIENTEYKCVDGSFSKVIAFLPYEDDVAYKIVGDDIRIYRSGTSHFLKIHIKP